MQLKEVLAKHRRFKSPGSLRKSLGDGYLFKTNPVFRSIRLAAIDFGYRFSANRFHDFDSLPLTQLPKILKMKIIPYVDNVRPLEAIEKKLPGVFSWKEVPPLRANSVMHESAHGVAHELRKIYLKRESQGVSLSPNQHQILQRLMEEAFANATECIANAYLLTAIDDEFFFKNAYIMESKTNREKLRSAIKQVGFLPTFRLLQLSYLYANFLKTRMESIPWNRVLELVFCEVDPMPHPKSMGVLKKAFAVGLSLDPTFTQFTNSFCLRLMGAIHSNLYEALDFDFLSVIENSPAYRRWFLVQGQMYSLEEPKNRKVGAPTRT